MIFVLGWVGMMLRKRHMLQVLMCMELMLLGVLLNFISMSCRWHSLHGQVMCLFILAVAAAETVVALAILVIYQNQKGETNIASLSDLSEE